VCSIQYTYIILLHRFRLLYKRLAYNNNKHTSVDCRIPTHFQGAPAALYRIIITLYRIISMYYYHCTRRNVNGVNIFGKHEVP